MGLHNHTNHGLNNDLSQNHGFHLSYIKNESISLGIIEVFFT